MMILITQKVNLDQGVEINKKRDRTDMLEGLPKRKYRKESQMSTTMKNSLQK